jgi:NAD-dependent SIR2 family protein deacetylase
VIRYRAPWLVGADAVLICSGAGMGVDSGLGTYRGTNAGHFGLDYEAICQPRWPPALS